MVNLIIGFFSDVKNIIIGSTIGCAAIGACAGPIGLLVCGTLGFCVTTISASIPLIVSLPIFYIKDKINGRSFYDTLFKDYEKEELEKLEKERKIQIQNMMKEYEKKLKEQHIECIGLFNIIKNNSYIKIKYDELQNIINKIVKYENKKDINELMKEKYFEQSLLLLQPISNKDYLKTLKSYLSELNKDTEYLSKLDLYSAFLDVLIRGNYINISKYDFKLNKQQNFIFQNIIKFGDLIFLLFQGYTYLIQNKQYINFKASIKDKDYINLSMYRIFNHLIHNKLFNICYNYNISSFYYNINFENLENEIIYILNCLSNISFDKFKDKTYENTFELNDLDIENFEFLLETFCIRIQYILKSF